MSSCPDAAQGQGEDQSLQWTGRRRPETKSADYHRNQPRTSLVLHRKQINQRS